MKRGRKRGAAGKELVGRAHDEIGSVATFGDDSGLTRGAKFVNDYTSESWLIRSENLSETPEMNSLILTLNNAILTRDDRLFAEISAYLAACNLLAKKGPLRPALQHVNRFVDICRNWSRDYGDSGYVKRSPALAKAMAKPKFTPSIVEIDEYLIEMMGDAAPSEKTTERLARIVGVAPRRYRRRTK